MDERNAIRKTWGKNTDSVTIRYIIGIGNIICYENYRIESKTYGDMLEINIYESFINETLFNLYTLKNLNKLCPYASYYAKFDVDTYVDMKKINNIINYNHQKYQFWGAEKQKWKRVNEDQSFKYSSPSFIAKFYNSIFPLSGIDVYSGFATLFTNDIPLLIYNYSMHYPYLMRIDDQYISWILYKLNITINRITSYAILPKKCNIYKNVTVIHRISSTDLVSLSIYITNAMKMN